MKKLLLTWGIVAFIALTSVFSGSPAFTAVPHTINYQGMITDSGGNPVTGPHILVFRIYDVATGGIILWEDTVVTQIDNGLLNVVLGEHLALNLSFDKPYWLEVQVNSDVMPRVQLTSVGYAYRAAVADSAVVAGGSTANFTQIRAEGTINAGSSDTLVIPHYIPWTLQLASGWPDYGGLCFVLGFENDYIIGITYNAYNGNGTSSTGGAEGAESGTTTLVSFGSSSYIYALKCPGEATGDHNIVLTAAGVELRYRLIY